LYQYIPCSKRLNQFFDNRLTDWNYFILKVRQPSQRIGLASKTADLQLPGKRKRLVADISVRPVLWLDHGYHTTGWIHVGSQEPGDFGHIHRDHRACVHGVHHVKSNQTHRCHHGKYTVKFLSVHIYTIYYRQLSETFRRSHDKELPVKILYYLLLNLRFEKIKSVCFRTVKPAVVTVYTYFITAVW